MNSSKILITWDFISPRGQHWLEWVENGRRKLKIVTDEFYATIKEKATRAIEPQTEDDFLN